MGEGKTDAADQRARNILDSPKNFQIDAIAGPIPKAKQGELRTTMTDAADDLARDIMDQACLSAPLATVDHALRRDIAQAIREAVAEENEACAKLANSEQSEVPIVAPGSNAAWDECARTIAAVIRTRQTKEG